MPPDRPVQAVVQKPPQVDPKTLLFLPLSQWFPGLENRCTASRYRGFESHLLRSQVLKTTQRTSKAAPRGAASAVSGSPAGPARTGDAPSHFVASGRISA